MTASHSYIRDHPLTGRELIIDLDQVIDELLPISPDSDRKGLALVKQAGLNMVITALAAGAQLSEHASRGVVVLQVLGGVVELRTERITQELGAGHLAVIDVLEPHGVTALEDAILLITTSMFEEVGGDISERSEVNPTAR